MSSSYVALGFISSNSSPVAHHLGMIMQHMSKRPGHLLYLFLASSIAYSGALAGLHLTGFLSWTSALVYMIVGIFGSLWIMDDLGELLLVYLPLCMNTGVLISYLVFSGERIFHDEINRGDLGLQMPNQKKGSITDEQLCIPVQEYTKDRERDRQHKHFFTIFEIRE
ncbi:hypothetical protein K440DRAFT_638175 [Wilcoxina mikolae CBS 423.85]|nr:hypothetical protein K440DRAFT_638175 [Wilcoxina mikolae CBS 423.85]